MANTVSFRVQVDDNGTTKKVEVNLQDLAQAMKKVKADADAVNGSIVNWAQAGQAADQLAGVFSQLQGVFSDLSSAYAQQLQGETKLAQAMRNTMDATDEEIQSIKNLCSEQQRLGVVGDEVQLAAAQELATYLEFSDSLKTIIPVMNDMVAQQLGLGASAESATQIASMLGKVMNGQTEALSRYGYKFSDAQKEILKYGDESERAAVLTEVIEQSVAGMNEALANTRAGRMQQLANSMGDVKEQLGQIISGIAPFMQLTSSFVTTTTGVIKLATSIKSLSSITAVAKVQALGLATAQKIQALAERMLASAGYTAAAGTTALKVAVAALYATITLGISLAIQGLIELFSALSRKSKEAAGDISEVDDATDAYRKTAAEMRGELAKECVELEDLIKKKKQTADSVKNLNDKYGEAFGYHSSAAEWYDILKNKSADYCKQLGYEAKAKVLAARSGDKQVELDEVRKKMANMRADGSATSRKLTTFKDVDGKTAGWGVDDVKTKAYRDLEAQAQALESSIAEDDAAMRECITTAQELAASLTKGSEDATTSVSWQKMTLSQLNKAIQEQKTKVEDLAGANAKEAKAEADVLAKMKARKEALEKTYGLGSGNKNEYDGSKYIENAKSYKELGNNIKYYQNALEKVNPEDKAQVATLTQKIAVLQKDQKAIQDLMDAAGRPVSLDSLEDIDKELAYQQGLRKTASKDALSGIDAEIKRLNDLKTAFEQSSHPELNIEQVTTYQQLEDELSYYSKKLKTASGEERAKIQNSINQLNKLKDSWDAVLDAMDKPADISALNSVEDLDKAVSYYSTLQKKANAEEAQNIQRTIDKLVAKKTMLETVAGLTSMEKELADLGGLSGKKLKLELDLIGLDGIRAKIKSLQKLLEDTDNPLGEAQAAQVRKLIASYQGYEKTLRKSNVTFREGWGDISGMGDSMTNLTEIIQGDGNAWDKLAGVIDNTLQLYESFNGIIEIIKSLTGVTEAHAVAKEVEGAASMKAASQEVAASAMETSAASVSAAAHGAEATAVSVDAAAKTFNAHASIPFVGIALGLAFVGAMIAMMASLPKFAKGGIAYGPTLGLFGEYSGASNNPEVVAPLDRLRSLIGGTSGVSGDVRFRIEGRTLVGVLKNEQGRTERLG